jgi:hypothetical protein
MPPGVNTNSSAECTPTNHEIAFTKSADFADSRTFSGFLHLHPSSFINARACGVSVGEEERFRSATFFSPELIIP